MTSPIFFTGVVESRQDPLKLGRVQVRVFGTHNENLDDVPTSSLPWAICLGHGAAVSGIGESDMGYVEGTVVKGYFEDGESKQMPIVFGSMPGIPVSKKTLQTSTEEVKSLGSPRVTSTVRPTADSTLVDTSGTPVTSSDGTPVSVASGALCCDSVDSSKLEKKFNSNVSAICKALCDFGIKNPYAVVAILANVAKECKFVPVREGLNYKTTARLREVFKKKFGNMPEEEAVTYLNNEEKLANFVYANQNGNGDVASGDGYKYRGGGFIQITFLNNWKASGKAGNVDLIANPEKITDPAVVAGYFIQRFGGANRLNFTNLDEALVTVTKKVNPGGFSTDIVKVREYAALCTVKLSEEAAQEVKAEKELTKPNAPENDIKPDATKAEIDQGIVNGSTALRTNTNIGFSDPNGKYPLDSTLKEQDTNRLARRNTSNTSVSKRMANRRSQIRSIDGTFEEPQPAYNAQYPYNHVRATESGHVFEADDTPGNERIATFHTSGTYEETDKYGNRINKIVGDSFQIIERNGYVYIDGTCRVTIGGNANIVVGGDAKLEIDGSLDANVGTDIVFKAGGDFKVDAGGKFSINAASDSSIDAPMLAINEGASESLGTSGRSANTQDYPRLIPDNFLDSESISFDDSEPAAVDAFHKEAVKKGTITEQELKMGDEAKPTETDTKKPPVITPLPASCAAFADKTDIPESTQLSKFFTLAMLSTKAKAGGHKVVAQHNLTESQIVCNLKMCAENCLDPIKAQYPNMFVTSGFRPGNSTSQHELGQAIDMQFDVPNGDYFAISQWIRDNVAFDKLLLEYKTNRSGKAWIHVAFRESPRREVYTYMNDKNAGTGLRKLQ